MSDDHECVFPEEQEPTGRLILAPCLVCEVSALDALDQVRRERDAARAGAAAASLEDTIRASIAEAIRAYSDALVQGMDAPLGPLLVQVALHRCERIARGEVLS